MIRQTMTRRTFLRASVAAAAAPYVITSSALGNTNKAPAGDRVAMGFIGIGRQGRFDLGQFANLKPTQVVALCEIDRQRLGWAVQDMERNGRHKGFTTCHDFREVLARGDIDAVYIATPDYWHVPIAAAACRAGKDVYCQKPLSLTIAEAKAAVEVARRYDRVFQVGTQNRSNAWVRLGCELARNGLLGRIKHVEISTWQTSWPCDLPAQPTPDGVDWDMFLGPAPWRPYHSGIYSPKAWIKFREYSGGGVTDLGAHFLDLAQWGLGTEDTEPVEILPPSANPRQLITYRYANGATIYLGWTREICQGHGNGHARFVGTRGSVTMDNATWAGVSTDPPGLLKETIAPEGVHLYRSSHHGMNFLECVRSRKRPAADVQVGCRGAILCHLGNLATWLDRRLRWDAAKSQFVGDDQANRMLSRAMREPWSL